MSPAVRLVVLAVAGTLILPAAAAEAKSGPCLADYPHGAQCHVWNGKVRDVGDGDTLDADIPHDGLGGLLRVRITGIQAMEQTNYRAAQRAGDCHAVQATTRLEQLVRRSKNRIRVSSQYPESRSRGRRMRSIAVRRGGRWRDVGRILVSEGLALWWPGQAEDAAQRPLQRAGAEGRRRAPRAVRPQRLRARAQRGPPARAVGAVGRRRQRPRGRQRRVREDPQLRPEQLRCRSDGWYLRDSSLNRFTFPSGAAIAPNSSVTVYAGQGEHFGGDYFWNLTKPVFENPTRDDRSMGDGAYLFDPQGDIRAWMIYPCKVGCTNPAQGQISLGTQPRRDEWISLTNNGGAVLDLEPYVLKSAPYSYAFPQGATLAPGQTIRVHTQGDPQEDTALDKYWGLTGEILNNGGDSATLVDVQRHRARLHRIRHEVLLT